jgi:short-subunit dehydrogenase
LPDRPRNSCKIPDDWYPPQVYIASRDIKACEATAQRLTKQGPGKCYALAADLSKYDDIVKLIEELGKREQSQCAVFPSILRQT